MNVSVGSSVTVCVFVFESVCDCVSVIVRERSSVPSTDNDFVGIRGTVKVSVGSSDCVGVVDGSTVPVAVPVFSSVKVCVFVLESVIVRVSVLVRVVSTVPSTDNDFVGV